MTAIGRGGRVAEPDLDRDRIAEQGLVNCNRTVNHRLNGGRVWIARNGAVERCLNRLAPW